MSIALSKIDLPVRRQKQKKAMGAWKPPMAFAFISNDYSSTGQASFMSAQHHQLPCITLKTFLTAVLFWINIESYLTNPSTPCQVFFELKS
jgi:hypothetical protein